VSRKSKSKAEDADIWGARAAAKAAAAKAGDSDPPEEELVAPTSMALARLQPIEIAPPRRMGAGRPDPRLYVLTQPMSPQAANFRVLRHRLQENGDARVIAVSSPRAAEGKSLCAANLALALGECNRARVLLVEAHPRGPSMARLFGISPPACFLDQLQAHRENPGMPWILADAPGDLHVAAIDPTLHVGSEVTQLTDWPTFHFALERFRAAYDYIVIDAPPVLGSAEVNLIQDAADGVLLTAATDRSRGRDLRKAVEQLQRGRLLGFALFDG
jgi:Mrp family chromosome partitioning ATPase